SYAYQRNSTTVEQKRLAISECDGFCEHSLTLSSFLRYSIIFYKFLRICKNSSLKNCILLEKLRRLRADDRIEDRNQEHLFDLNKKRQPGSVVPKAAIKFPILTQINLH
uniref:hypothetical protein n=1 Tax=Anaeromusa acidaminophila TaxID=81464 RepID=UPI0005856C34